MAQKKGGGSTRNGRDSQPKMLGVKVFGGQIGFGRLDHRAPARHQVPCRHQRRHGHGPHAVRAGRRHGLLRRQGRAEPPDGVRQPGLSAAPGSEPKPRPAGASSFCGAGHLTAATDPSLPSPSHEVRRRSHHRRRRRQWRHRLRELPAREVHPLRRPQWWRRRSRRQRLCGGRSQPQYADRLSLRAAARGAQRRERARFRPVRRRRRRTSCLRMPVGTIITDARDRRRSLPNCWMPDETVLLCQGRRRRLRQPALQDQHQPRTAPEDTRLARRAEEAQARIARAGRCRPAGHAQRRQVHA